MTSGLPQMLHTISFPCPSALKDYKSHCTLRVLRSEALLVSSELNRLAEPTSFGPIRTMSPVMHSAGAKGKEL
jgi:hypothetical protein